MFNIGAGEMIVIALILLMAVGPEQLPGLIRRVGRTVSEVKGMTEGLRSEFMSGLEEIERATDPEAWAAGTGTSTPSSTGSTTNPFADNTSAASAKHADTTESGTSSSDTPTDASDVDAPADAADSDAPVDPSDADAPTDAGDADASAEDADHAFPDAAEAASNGESTDDHAEEDAEPSANGVADPSVDAWVAEASDGDNSAETEEQA